MTLPTPQDIQNLRTNLGLSRFEFARALGFKGNEKTCYKQIKMMEQGREPLYEIRLPIFLALQAEYDESRKEP
jgi:hypothetical protein